MKDNLECRNMIFVKISVDKHITWNISENKNVKLLWYFHLNTDSLYIATFYQRKYYI